MDADEAKSLQGQVFQEIIEEFKKNEPSDQRIKECMKDLSLEYNDDAFANMQSVLNALSFETKSIDFDSN